MRKDTQVLIVAAMLLERKLLERLPLCYSLVRNLAWIQPLRAVSESDACIKELKRCSYLNRLGMVSCHPVTTS